MPIKRHADSVYLQYIWNAIESCSRNSIESTLQELLSFIQKEYDSKCTAGKLQSELANAVEDKCIAISQRSYIKCDVPLPSSSNKHDWYCFECHGPGDVVACPTCFRVYHPSCLSSAYEALSSFRLPHEDNMDSVISMSAGFPPESPCPICRRLARAAKFGATTGPVELHKIFLVALDWIKSKVNWKTMQVVGYLNESQRNSYLVYEQINTQLIAERMRARPDSKHGYLNRTSLLVDLDNLVHNTAVFYGSKNDMSNMARSIRFQLKREMRESTYCVDCYLKSQSSSSINRLTAPCRIPHRLLWFQHNGWSFRPCKMLYENSEGYEVICFGGRHERVFVPLSRAVDMSFTALELGLRMTPPLKKALDEAEEYKANQSTYNSQSNNESNNAEFNLNLDSNNNNSNNSVGGVKHRSTNPNNNNKVNSTTRKRKARKSKYSDSVKLSTSEPTSESYNKRDSIVHKPPGSSSSSSKLTVFCKASDVKTDHWAVNSADSDGNLTSLSSLNSNPVEFSVSQTSSTLDSDRKISSETSKIFDQNPKVKSSRFKHRRASSSSTFDDRDDMNDDDDDDDNNGSDSDSDCSNSVSAVRSSNSEFFTMTNLKPTTIRIKQLPMKPESSNIIIPSSKIIPDLKQSSSANQLSRTKSFIPCSSSTTSCQSSGKTIAAICSRDNTSISSSATSYVSDSYKRSSTKAKGRGSKTERSRLKKNNSVKSVDANSNSNDAEVCNRLSLTTTTTTSSSSRLHNNDHGSSEFTNRISPKPSMSNFVPNADKFGPSNLHRKYSRSCSSTSTSSTSNDDSDLSTTSSPLSNMPEPGYNSRIKLTAYKHDSHKTLVDKVFDGDDDDVSDAVSDVIDDDDDDTVQATNKSKDDKSRFHGKPKSNRVGRRSGGPVRTVSSFSSKQQQQPTERHNKHFNVTYSSAPNSTIKTSQSALENGLSKTSSSIVGNGFNPSKLPTAFSDQTTSGTNNTHNNITATGGSIGPTPPSNSSAASSCYSSVSPAALSSTSGLGSSLSDPKSVDASPSEVATMLGNAPFSCPSSGNGFSQNASYLLSDANMAKAEDRIHRIYADRLFNLTTELDQARAEMHRRDAFITELKRAHEAEIKRIKQRTWCQVCLNEAYYHCCPGTAYCSEACQLQHWTVQHNRDCRRRLESQQIMPHSSRS